MQAASIGVLAYATGRILIGTFCVRTQLAVFVATGIGVLRAEQAGIAFFIALDAKVATK